MNGVVIKSTGSWYKVKVGENVVDARLRGKFKLDDKKITNPIAVGDHVRLERQGESQEEEWVITSIEERSNYIVRQSPRKKKHDHLLACNVDQAMVVATMKMPRTSLGFIDRFLVTLEAFRIPGIVIFNKSDLLDEEELQFLEFLASRYEIIGYHTVITSFQEHGIKDVESLFTGKITLLSGHSGAGKSTLVNQLVKEADQKISEISDFANKGVHTTTFAEMFFIDEHSGVIDTPGIKELGISEIEKEELGHYFPEMRERLGQCRFHNCLHVNEPGCVIKQAVESGEIFIERYHSYLSILEGEDNRR